MQETQTQRIIREMRQTNAEAIAATPAYIPVDQDQTPTERFAEATYRLIRAHNALGTDIDPAYVRARNNAPASGPIYAHENVATTITEIRPEARQSTGVRKGWTLVPLLAEPTPEEIAIRPKCRARFISEEEHKARQVRRSRLSEVRVYSSAAAANAARKFALLIRDGIRGHKRSHRAPITLPLGTPSLPFSAPLGWARGFGTGRDILETTAPSHDTLPPHALAGRAWRIDTPEALVTGRARLNLT